MVFKEVPDSLQRDWSRLLRRIPVNAGGNAGERDGSETVFDHQVQAGFVTALQEVLLYTPGAHCVYDV